MIGAFGFITRAFAADPAGGYSPEMQARIDEVKKELKKFKDERETVKRNIETFDELDFVVFSNQVWTRLMKAVREGREGQPA